MIPHLALPNSIFVVVDKIVTKVKSCILLRNEGHLTIKKPGQWLSLMWKSAYDGLNFYPGKLTGQGNLVEPFDSPQSFAAAC